MVLIPGGVQAVINRVIGGSEVAVTCCLAVFMLGYLGIENSSYDSLTVG